QLEAMKASSSRILSLEDDKKQAEKLRRRARERAEYEMRLSEAQARVDSAQEELDGLSDTLGKNPVNGMNRAEAEKAAGDFRSAGKLLAVLLAAAVLISAALAVFFGWLLAIAAIAVFAVLIIITARRRNRAGKILARLGTTDPDRLRRAFDEAEELKTQIAVSLRRVREEEKNLDAIKASDGSYDGPTAEAAEKAYEQVLTALAAENAKLNNYGDPVVTECELGQCRARLEKAKREYAAIETAIEALRQANETVRSRFSPALTRRAGEIMAELTGGRYDALSFNREFDAEARVNGDAIFRDALSLSTGTLDQLYFALRLAIAELALDSEETCPIILDDALLSFDDERMASALTMLERMSEKRQIILFTCHSREKKWLETR
ncbi:MAG: hypothetical protein HUJ65_07765, partial [Oscillospiraceae bacterium]|nr:hypothetical protein [Oscillospiraceae bacterium]